MASETLLKMVEACLRMGSPLLLEDVGESIEPALEPLLSNSSSSSGGRRTIKLGDANIDVDENFKLYLACKLPNPHFLPEVFIKVTVINFTVTALGLEEQLLADVVAREKPEIEKAKTELILTIAKGKIQLKKNEDRILELLASSKGMILDDVELI